MTLVFYSAYFSFSCFVYFDFYAPQHQGKLFVPENLVDNEPVSDSDSDSEKLKCYQSGQMGFLFNWLLLFLFLLQLFANW